MMKDEYTPASADADRQPNELTDAELEVVAAGKGGFGGNGGGYGGNGRGYGGGRGYSGYGSRGAFGGGYRGGY